MARVVPATDQSLAEIARIGTGGGQGYVLEYRGSAIRGLSMEARMTIANMTTEWGALAGVFPFDEMTVKYLRSRVDAFSNPGRPGTRGSESRSGYSNSDIVA